MELVENLHYKMANAIYDIGEYFEIIDDEENSTFAVRAKKDIDPFSTVFIVEHALTFRYPDLRRILQENTSLIGRVQEMLKYHQNPWKLPGPA